MLSCKELVAHSSSYLDGQLGLRQRLAVRAHLAICQNCQRFIKQMRLSQGVLRRLARSNNVDIDNFAAQLAAVRRGEV